MQDNVYEDEISLKEIITSLLNHWVMILSITLLAGTIGFLYAFIIASPVYESTTEGTINIPETIRTRFGEYPLTSAKHGDYLMFAKSENVLNKTIEDLGLDTSVSSLKNSISIINSDESNVFSLVAKASSPEMARQIVQTITDNFIKEINLVYKEKSIDYFLRDNYVNIDSQNKALIFAIKQIEESKIILSDMDPTITLRKLMLTDPVYASSIAIDRNIRLEELSEETMLVEVINPQYDQLDNEILALKKQALTLEDAIDNTENSISLLEKEKESFDAFRIDGNQQLMTQGMLEFMDAQIMIHDRANLPDNPVAPNKKMIVAVSVVLGGMMAVFMVFIKEAWNSDTASN